MDNRTTKKCTTLSFKTFVLKERRYRIMLWFAACAILVQFSIFKYFYPYPSFIHGDSFSYIKAAYYNLDINTYLIGYSRFLRLFSVFSSSAFALVSFQYIFLQV